MRLSRSLSISLALLCAGDPAMHIGDLDGWSTNQGRTWDAYVMVTVHDGDHNPVSGATVTGGWAAEGSATCTTDGTGQCVLGASGNHKRDKTSAFSVSGVTHSLTYDHTQNHDPDGDSDGTSIEVSKP